SPGGGLPRAVVVGDSGHPDPAAMQLLDETRQFLAQAAGPRPPGPVQRGPLLGWGDESKPDLVRRVVEGTSRARRCPAFAAHSLPPGKAVAPDRGHDR